MLNIILYATIPIIVSMLTGILFNMEPQNLKMLVAAGTLPPTFSETINTYIDICT